MAPGKACYNYHSNMNTHQGFSLIECLIYSAITGFLSILLFSFFNNVTSSIRLVSNRENDSLSLWSAHQLFCKDIQMADAQSNLWHKSSDGIVCKVGDACIGWQLRKNSVYRLKGDYDFSAQQWRRKSTALVVQNVKHFRVELHGQEKMVTAVRYELETVYDTQIETIMLENRSLN